MDLRLYTFINFYLSPIQQGIQTAHLVHELFNQFGHLPSHESMLHEWSESHKTIIVCSAGVDADIQELMDEFSKHDFPFTSFTEDAGLCNARTGCGVVLPEEIYGVEWIPDAAKITKGYWAYYPSDYSYLKDESKIVVYDHHHPLWNLIRLVKSKRLA